MSSVESHKYDNLIYLRPQFQARDLLDYSIEKALSKLARVDTDGTERNIPSKGRLVIGSIPHTGFLEAPLIDEVLLSVGRRPAVLITKEGSRELPGFIQTSRRLIYINRDNPQPSSGRPISQVLRTENGTISSSLEGTRFSNNEDLDDVLTLGESKPGLMRFSYDYKTPIMGVVVLGVNNILPSLDIIIKEKGMIEALKLVASGFFHPKEVQMRFLPPYTDHLNEKRNDETTHDFVKRHNDRFTGKLIKEILNIDPNYPLGYYKNHPVLSSQ